MGFNSCGSRAVERRLSSCGTRAELLCGVWDLPGPGLEPVSPALAGGFFFFLSFLKKKNYLFIYLAALGLRCCARAFSSCSERGLLFVAVRGLLIAVASLVAEHSL